MAGLRALRSVLHNFLETLSSRYSDLDGYWIWGQVVTDVDGRRIDLLGTGELENAAPVGALVQLARERFVEQLTKQGITPSRVEAASLSIACVGGARAFVNGPERPGYHVTLTVVATVGGRHDSCTTTLIAAPHEPALESRRAAAQRGWAR